MASARSGWGRRAAWWRFRFRVVPESNREAALAYAGQPGRLAVGISPDADELEAIRSRCPHHVLLQARPVSDGDVVPRLVAALSTALHGAGRSPLPETAIDWNGLMADLLDQPIRTRQAPPVSVSVCVLHYDRLPLLQRALSSIPRKRSTVRTSRSSSSTMRPRSTG